MSDRLCDRCGEPYPKLSHHICTMPPEDDPEVLCALLWDAINSVPLDIGTISISPQIAMVLARPLARELMTRVDDLLAAVREELGR